jgi:hypothetical protein
VGADAGPVVGADAGPSWGQTRALSWGQTRARRGERKSLERHLEWVCVLHHLGSALLAEVTHGERRPAATRDYQ